MAAAHPGVAVVGGMGIYRQERRSELGRDPALIAAIGNTEFGALFAWIPILYRGIGARLVTKAYVHDSIRKIFLTFPARLRGSVICTSP